MQEASGRQIRPVPGDSTVAIRLGVPAVAVVALVFGAATIAMFVSDEMDALLVVAALVVAAVITGLLFVLGVLVRGWGDGSGANARRGLLLAALVGGLLAATPVPWEWGPHSDDTGWVALWETPRLVAISDAAPLVPYVSDTLD
jgi:hypothetical protein